MTTTGVTYNHKNGQFWQLDFTGKERDPETGYSYFGARYLDHTPLTLWLSVDPMADKYPSITPYAYCAWNPLKLVDPDGCEDTNFYNYEGQWLGTDGKTDDCVYVAKSVTKDSKGFVVSYNDAELLSIGNEELLDRATWVCGESGGSGEYITNRTQNAGDAMNITNATVAEYYAAAINNMSINTRGGFYAAIKIRMSRKGKNGDIIYSSEGYFSGTGKGGNVNSKAFANARKMGGDALNADSRFTNSIAAVIYSVTNNDPTGGCRAWLGGEKYAKPYVDNQYRKKDRAVVQFSFQSKAGFHTFYSY